MEPDHSSVPLSNIISQLRGALSNLYLAASQLAPASAREQDPALDARAALVDRSYYQLLRLINNLSAAQDLDSSAPLPLRDQDLVDLVQRVFAQAADQAPRLGLELSLRCPMDRHFCAFDASSLEHLLFHLLSNAFKFTPAGGRITLELHLASQQVHLSVQDTGPGIPPERRLTLFSQWRCEGALSLPPHGMGLGLALCQRIARGHGGTLALDPSVTQGSRFVFSMPDRLVGRSIISDIPCDYSGGFNPTLLSLADVLPPEAFRMRNQN